MNGSVDISVPVSYTHLDVYKRQLRERMIDLRSGTVVFVGGGAILLRRQIEASGKIGRLIFVDEINANAKGYEFLYQLEMAGR